MVYAMKLKRFFWNALGLDKLVTMLGLLIALLAGPCGTAVAQTESFDLVLPKPGTMIASPNVTFLWQGEGNATAFRIGVASRQGLLGTAPYGDLFVYEGAGTSVRAVGLPGNGSPIFVRLWTFADNVWQYKDYVYGTKATRGVVPSSIKSPAPGSLLDSPVTQFEWSGSGAQRHLLTLGSTPESISSAPWFDLYYYEGRDTAASTWPLTLPGKRIYARLWSVIDGQIYYEDDFFDTATAQAAQISSPGDGSRLDSPAVDFRWTPAPYATQYMLAVGASAEVVAGPPYADLYFYRGTEPQVRVPNIPQDGSPVYVRLWTSVEGLWLYHDYTYTTGAAEPAHLLTPQPGDLIATPRVSFSWSGDSGASTYMLGVAATAEALEGPTYGDVFRYVGSDTSVDAELFPLPGGTIHVRLWSMIKGVWYTRDYQFDSEALVAAQLTAPSGMQPLEQSFVEFRWDDVGADEYALGVGTSLVALDSEEGGDIYFRSLGTATSRYVSDIPLNGDLLYVRVWSRFDDLWFFEDREFNTVLSEELPDPVAECLAKGWHSHALPSAHGDQSVLWKAPLGPWTKGALVVLHGGGGHNAQWCATSGTGNALTAQAMNDFSEQAIREGFAVFAVDSGDGSFSDALGFQCGKRFDFTNPAEENLDLALFKLLFESAIPSVRPSGSATDLFVTGLSNGGYMAIRLATRFNEMITAFAPVAAGDPYGTTLWCEQKDGLRENAPGVSLDNETSMEISLPDACLSAGYPNETLWDGSDSLARPPFRAFRHQADPVVDTSCSEKAELLLEDNGYAGLPPYIVTREHPDPDSNHYWQEEYNLPLLDFFSGVAAP
jgi:hypothetical protein